MSVKIERVDIGLLFFKFLQGLLSAGDVNEVKFEDGKKLTIMGRPTDVVITGQVQTASLELNDQGWLLEVSSDHGFDAAEWIVTIWKIEDMPDPDQVFKVGVFKNNRRKFAVLLFKRRIYERLSGLSSTKIEA